MTNDAQTKANAPAAVITGKRINPDFLRHLRVKTKVRNTPQVQPVKELPPQITAEIEVKATAPSEVVSAKIPEAAPIKFSPKVSAAPKAPKQHAAPKAAQQATQTPPPPAQKLVSEKVIVRPEPVEFDDSGSFADMLQEMSVVKEAKFNAGDKVTATLLHIGKESAFLTLGQKTEAAMDLMELQDTHGELMHRIGERIECFVIFSKGELRLTKKLGRESIDWDMLVNAKETGMPIDAKVEKVCKGGFEVWVAGMRGFCPLGQIDNNFVAGQEESYVGTTQTFLVTEASPSTRNLVVSRKAYLESIRKENEAELLSRICVGDIIEGSISRVATFGAFVDIGGTEGLIPLSQMAHGFVKNAEEYCQVGDKVSVQIMSIEPDQKREGRMRISLSLKAIAQDPYQEFAHKLVAGTRLTGKVMRLEKFGAFIELFAGVDGLLHSSEIDRKQNLMIGQQISVQILDVDKQNRRISLTLSDGPDQFEHQNSGELKSASLSGLAKMFAGKL